MDALTTQAIQPPIPTQGELLSISPAVVIQEYVNAERDQCCHLAEVALRYLIFQIITDKPTEEIKRFANQIRLDLNDERQQRARERILSFAAS
ncbi:MAG: hypothetical protein LRY66_08450 [Saccharospirillaceae bacterium]|nr:hypothetical protein [Saccharospirillaceae bacterium]MCD8531379.1 hypothetical protein [Saccharospirillaceae bacterium]